MASSAEMVARVAEPEPLGWDVVGLEPDRLELAARAVPSSAVRARPLPIAVKALAQLPALLIGAEVLALAAAGIVTRLWLPLIVFAAVLLPVRFVSHVYRPRLALSMLDEVPLVTRTLLAALTLTVAGLYLAQQAAGTDTLILRDLTMILMVYLPTNVVLAGCAFAAVRAVRRRWRLARRAVVIGDGTMARQLASLMAERPEYGLRPMQVLSAGQITSADGLSAVVARSRAEVLVMAFSPVREAELLDTVIHVSRSGIDLLVVPRLFELVHDEGSTTERLHGFPLVRYRRDPSAQPLWWTKRLTDVVLSSLAIVAISPVLLAAAAMVLIDSGRPVLFRQERIGRDGVPFDILKFRSMRPANDQESQTTWSIATDTRVSAIGRFLRRTSLDELPQLFNILRGEMSLVGPRPERPGFVDKFSDEHERYWARHRVPVGLTGLAQVNKLRGDTSIPDRARYDNYYIANWSPWLDVKIMLLTISEVFSGAGR